MHIYNEDFYDYQYVGSLKSAEIIINILLDYLELNSVLDVGCGVGPWLKVYKSKGASVIGIDGDYVNKQKLLIDEADFIPADLKQVVSLNKTFSMAQSLEVAEHIPEPYADRFVQTLVDHSECVLFSAAVPGQGGEDHVNERPLEYWREKFEKKGYIPFDLIRPLVEKSANKEQVEKWYRYNSILYIKKNTSLAKSEKLKPFRIEENTPLKIYSDFLWSLRKMAVRWMPAAISTAIAKVNASRIAFMRRSG